MPTCRSECALRSLTTSETTGSRGMVPMSLVLMKTQKQSLTLFRSMAALAWSKPCLKGSTLM